MPKWLVLLVVAVLIHLIALTKPVLATPVVEKQGDQVRVALAKMETGSRTRIAVTLRNKNKVTGYLDEVRDYSFFVTDPETHVSTQIAYKNVKQLNALSTGAKVAITAVVVGGVLIWYFAWLAPRLAA